MKPSFFAVVKGKATVGGTHFGSVYPTPRTIPTLREAVAPLWIGGFLKFRKPGFPIAWVPFAVASRT